MDEAAVKFEQFRDSIIADPDAVLDDQEVMRALIAANGDTLGENVVDLRGIALNRMEDRLARLEDTHRSVIAAAYDNLAGTNQIHRVSLRVLDAEDFNQFLEILSKDVPEILGVDAVRLVMETHQTDQANELQGHFNDLLKFVPLEYVDHYLTGRKDAPARQVVLRQIAPDENSIYGKDCSWVRSEACLRLDFGASKQPGLLALASEDPHRFKPTHGTDLLGYFASVFERVMKRWLA